MNRLTKYEDENGSVGGEIIFKTAQIATDMEEFEDWLEELNGGPLKADLPMQCSFYEED